MNHTKKEIVDALNDSGKLEKIRSITILEDSFHQGILGNLKKIKPQYFEHQFKVI